MILNAADNEEEENDTMNDAIDVMSGKQQSVTTDPHVDKLWSDMNASTTVSKTAVNRTAKVDMDIRH